MALINCVGGCGRVISISVVPEGNEVALMMPDIFARHYQKCPVCGTCLCDICLRSTCPECGEEMVAGNPLKDLLELSTGQEATKEDIFSIYIARKGVLEARANVHFASREGLPMMRLYEHEEKILYGYFMSILFAAMEKALEKNRVFADPAQKEELWTRICVSAGKMFFAGRAWVSPVPRKVSGNAEEYLRLWKALEMILKINTPYEMESPDIDLLRPFALEGYVQSVDDVLKGMLVMLVRSDMEELGLDRNYEELESKMTFMMSYAAYTGIMFELIEEMLEPRQWSECPEAARMVTDLLARYALRDDLLGRPEYPAAELIDYLDRVSSMRPPSVASRARHAKAVLQQRLSRGMTGRKNDREWVEAHLGVGQVDAALGMLSDLAGSGDAWAGYVRALVMHVLGLGNVGSEQLLDAARRAAAEGCEEAALVCELGRSNRWFGRKKLLKRLAGLAERDGLLSSFALLYASSRGSTRHHKRAKKLVKERLEKWLLYDVAESGDGKLLTVKSPTCMYSAQAL